MSEAITVGVNARAQRAHEVDPHVEVRAQVTDEDNIDEVVLLGRDAYLGTTDVTSDEE